MWARHMELALGLWLLVSPWVFRHAPDQPFLWRHDLVCGALIAAISLAAHWTPLRRRHLHLLQLPIAAWLAGYGWWCTWVWDGATQLPAAFQNWILLGLILAMFAIVPSRASAPPERWQRHLGAP